MRASVTRSLGLRLTDHLTGLQLELPSEAGAWLDALSCDPEKPLPPEAQQLRAQLEALGLTNGLPLSEVLRRQARFVLDQAFEAQHPELLDSLKIAATRTRFHRARLESASLEITRPEDLLKLPLMYKQDLRERLGDLIIEGTNVPEMMASGDVVFTATSGTTGERLQVVSDTRLSALPPSFEELWGLEALWEEQLPRTAVFTSPVCAGPICHKGKTSLEERTVAGNTLFLNSDDDIFSLRRELAENVFEELWRFRPDFLVVNPVYLSVLCERGAKWNLRPPPIKAILSSYQFLSRCQRRILRRHFDCPIIDFYAASDLAGSKVAVQCMHGSLHLRGDHVYAEVVRGARHAALDEMGYLVLTTFNSLVPLVRYVLGDLARLEPKPCRCAAGSSWPRIAFEGRARDMLYTNDRFITTRMVDEQISPLPAIHYYELREVQPQDFELRIVVAPGAASPAEEAKQLVQDLLAAKRVTVREVEHLRPENGQKFRFTIPFPQGRAAFDSEYPGLTDDLLDRYAPR